MIDRGALVRAPVEGSPYRGPHRPPLDAMRFTGRKGKELAREYQEAVGAAGGVLEDLDDAIAFTQRAQQMGFLQLEVIVFEVPQEPAPRAGTLPVAPTPPAEGLELLGWDVIELLEPWWSPLSKKDHTAATNSYGLFSTRKEAEDFCTEYNSKKPDDELHTIRVWLCRT